MKKPQEVRLKGLRKDKATNSIEAKNNTKTIRKSFPANCVLICTQN